MDTPPDINCLAPITMLYCLLTNFHSTLAGMRLVHTNVCSVLPGTAVTVHKTKAAQKLNFCLNGDYRTAEPSLPSAAKEVAMR